MSQIFAWNFDDLSNLNSLIFVLYYIFVLFVALLDSTTENANGGDWQDDVYEIVLFAMVFFMHKILKTMEIWHVKIWFTGQF